MKDNAWSGLIALWLLVNQRAPTVDCIYQTRVKQFSEKLQTAAIECYIVIRKDSEYNIIAI